MLEYQLIRSKRRKTLGLQVKAGRITVRAPFYVTTEFIDSFIQEKSVWLKSKLSQQVTENNFCHFSQGDSVLFGGEQYTLNISRGKRAEVFTHDVVESFDSDKPVCTSSPQQEAHSKKILTVVISNRVDSRLITPELEAIQVKKQLETYFKQQAEQLFPDRLLKLSNQIGLRPNQINIRQYRARWGSCNNRGEISLNYLLIMAPIFVIDYVIIHELCHLAHLNHSKAFWLLVAQHDPNYQQAKLWLKKHQGELTWHNPA